MARKYINEGGGPGRGNYKRLAVDKILFSASVDEDLGYWIKDMAAAGDGSISHAVNDMLRAYKNHVDSLVSAV